MAQVSDTKNLAKQATVWRNTLWDITNAHQNNTLKPTKYDIVLIDDEIGTLQSYQRLIQSFLPIVTIKAYTNPAEAFEDALTVLNKERRGLATLIVSDIMMGSLSGDELVKRLRSHYLNASLKYPPAYVLFTQLSPSVYQSYTRSDVQVIMKENANEAVHQIIKLYNNRAALFVKKVNRKIFDEVRANLRQRMQQLTNQPVPQPRQAQPQRPQPRIEEDDIELRDVQSVTNDDFFRRGRDLTVGEPPPTDTRARPAHPVHATATPRPEQTQQPTDRPERPHSPATTQRTQSTTQKTSVAHSNHASRSLNDVARPAQASVPLRHPSQHQEVQTRRVSQSAESERRAVNVNRRDVANDVVNDLPDVDNFIEKKERINTHAGQGIGFVEDIEQELSIDTSMPTETEEIDIISSSPADMADNTIPWENEHLENISDTENLDELAVNEQGQNEQGHDETDVSDFSVRDINSQHTRPYKQSMDKYVRDGTNIVDEEAKQLITQKLKQAIQKAKPSTAATITSIEETGIRPGHRHKKVENDLVRQDTYALHTNTTTPNTAPSKKVVTSTQAGERPSDKVLQTDSQHSQHNSISPHDPINDSNVSHRNDIAVPEQDAAITEDVYSQDNHHTAPVSANNSDIFDAPDDTEQNNTGATDAYSDTDVFSNALKLARRSLLTLEAIAQEAQGTEALAPFLARILEDAERDTPTQNTEGTQDSKQAQQNTATSGTLSKEIMTIPFYATALFALAWVTTFTFSGNDLPDLNYVLIGSGVTLLIAFVGALVSFASAIDDESAKVVTA